MITCFCIFHFIDLFFFDGVVRKLVAKGGGAYVERLSETTPRIMVEERTTSECGVDEVHGRDGGKVLHGLLGLK